MKYPKTKKIPIKERFFDVEIEDPYRWLEDLDSQDTHSWIEAQNKLTFDYLKQIPYREKIKQRFTEVLNYPKYQQPFKAGKYYLYLKNDGLQNQSVVYIIEDLNSEPKLFLDPNKFSEDQTISLEDISVSNDGKYVAYATSKNGSDWREIFVIGLETGQHLDDHIKDVKFSGVNWYKDGFFYNKYSKSAANNKFTASNTSSKVYYHKLGTRQESDLLIYKNENKEFSYHGIWSGEDEKYIFLYKSEPGKKGNSLYYKYSIESNEDFRPIIETMDFKYWSINNIDNILFLYTNENAMNGKIISIDLENISIPPITILPEKPEPLSGIRLAARRLIATYMKNVIDRTYVYDLNGNYLHEVIFPCIGNVTGFNGKIDDKTVFYTFSSMIKPPEIFLYEIETNTSKSFRKSEVKFNPEDYEAKQVFYTSRDSTSIPMFLMHKKGLILDGNNPVLMHSYGGFGNSMIPNFNVSNIVLLENGGVYALPNIRGGSEYGEKWHEAGMLFNKQNVFDDFISGAEYLIKEGYTSPKKLAISGRSNGGLLIGAVVNQRPDLFRAAVPEVGVMDMLRFHKFTIGASWITEYGSSDDPEQFKYLLGYSPLHNIKVDVEYPAILVTTSDHDDRVVPSHSFKYIATLQEKYKGRNPVLIRIELKAGHGYGKPTSMVIEQNTDIWSFLFYNMGITPVY